MITIEKNLIEQISLFKKYVIDLIHNHGFDENQEVKVLDILILAELIQNFYEINHGERVAQFIGYQRHPCKGINILKILNKLEDEKQIKICKDLKNPEFIKKCEMPGSDRDFTKMLEVSINKKFLILSNFNMPPSDSTYSIPIDLITTLPAKLTPTILEINKAYFAGLNIACGILLRRLLEGAIILKHEQLKKMNELKKEDGDYIGLKGMIKIMFNEPSLSFPAGLKNKVNSIKWLGDKGAHNFDLEIFRVDIKNNLINVREFLETIKLKK